MRLSDFKGASDVLRFAAAMDYLRAHPGSTLTVEPGVYHLTSDLAKNAMQAVLSGKWGANPQSVMFNPSYEYTRGISLDGQRGSTIEAYGVTLMVEGFMEPLSIINCADVTICGLTIDHLRKPYSWGVVTDISEKNDEGVRRCTVELDEKCPVQPCTPLNLRHIFFDSAAHRKISAQVRRVDYVDARHLTVTVAQGEGLRCGQEFYTIHTFHARPAILIENAKNIRLRDVTIHSQPGMGIVGNRSQDLLLSGVRVIPSPGQHWSSNTDATHFTSIKGLLRYENCIFEGQGDDSANIHAYYQDIEEKESPRTCYLKEKTPDGTHAQTLDYPDVGDVLELTDKNTLQVLDRYTVLSCTPLHKEWRCKVTLDHDLPDNTAGLVMADVTRLPKLEIVNCHASLHFARGLLIKSRGALIEGNTFSDIPIAGIEGAAESYWYEGVSPSDLIIRHNRIENCGCGIIIKADCPDPKGLCIKNIVIEDNTIHCPDARYGIYLRNVDGALIARNRITAKGTPVFYENCANIDHQ
ncbi:MAG: right-handed parallel beta-helix repeat-containing protein [Clostridia bacterium]|nr:right-handed parallel beta-helix repeat-containing protein [Clostridia bacterium]